MADNKPTKPSSTLPTTWGGTKTAYTSAEVSSGYEDNVPEIIDGGNLNYSMCGVFERLNYLTILADIINAMPIGKSLTVDDNNRFDYYTPVSTNDIDTKISTMLASLYPVGSIYIGTQNTCPLASLITGSTWTIVGKDKALWGGSGSNANTTIAAGLPNVSGNLGGVDRVGSGQSGPFYTDGTNPKGSGGTTSNNLENIKFSLSKANSIYGNSTTVQPPAYRVNVWRRTA